jgi:hypothetical protein
MGKFKWIFIIIAIFNIFDGILTYLGLTFGYMYEVNTFMTTIASSLVGMIFLKIILIPSTLFLIYMYIEKNPLTLTKHIFILPLVVYSIILLLHINIIF